jgi:signal transduction histidine kinase/ActR/RegA family two-component response regulator
VKLDSNGNGHAHAATGPIVVDTLMSPWDWSASRDEHFVQFYEEDDFIVDSICRFVNAGLDSGETVVVAATDDHLNAVNSRLSQRGVDVVAALTTGHYVTVNAEKTLAQVKKDGHISPARFNEILGGTMLRTALSGRHVRVFGELVALLCAEGNHKAAVQLENLWNDLKLKHRFSLFCAYPMQGFSQSSIEAVCNTHSHVIPAESFTTLPTGKSQSRAIAVLQQKAQLLENEVQERLKAEENLRLAKEQLESQIEELGKLITSEQIARAEAETANRLKDEFLATVSHELRTPLNAIIGWAHMLRRGRLDDETQVRALETIERNAKSQAQLIEDILDVSRMINGKTRLQMAPVNVASVINQAVDAVQLAASSKGIVLQVTLDPSVRYVLGDASRLQQVVWNLLSNAIKFTPAGGRVEVVFEGDESNARITVADTGQGIGEEFLPHVFERFRQADGASTRVHGGLGLGLALVRHLVELHGGTVRARSEGKGRGAAFIVKLPLAPDKALEAQSCEASKDLQENSDLSGTAPSSIAALEGRRILIVDDHTDTLQMLGKLLSNQRAQIELASSAEQALEILEWYQPDVIVLDLAMPGEDGYSLIQKIRRHEQATNWKVPAVALTAQVRVEDRARALSVGFDMFVPKPVEADELITAIKTLTAPSRVT